jgi:lipoate-protein ligase B
MQFLSFSGLTSYPRAQEIQAEFVDLRARGLVPDTVLFFEHTPVITRGRGLQIFKSRAPGPDGAPGPRHMPVPVQLPVGMGFADSERGGDLTYHGPGQLVIYPIFKLDGSGFSPANDIAGYLRRFEDLLIDELSHWGLRGSRRDGATGVWVGDRKIASIGVAVRKWVTYHGAALNVMNDLAPFHLISPCGFAPEVMTRLEDLVPRAKFGATWSVMRAKIETRLARAFDPSQRASVVTRIDGTRTRSLEPVEEVAMRGLTVGLPRVPAAAQTVG